MKVFLCDGLRTQIGQFGGGLADLRPNDLAAHVLHALLARHPSLDPDLIDGVLFGCANQTGKDTLCVGVGQGVSLAMERI